MVFISHICYFGLESMICRIIKSHLLFFSLALLALHTTWCHVEMHLEDRKNEIMCRKQWENCRCGFAVQRCHYSKAIIFTQGGIHFKKRQRGKSLTDSCLSSPECNATTKHFKTKRPDHPVTTARCCTFRLSQVFASVVLKLLKVALGNTGNNWRREEDAHTRGASWKDLTSQYFLE